MAAGVESEALSFDALAGFEREDLDDALAVFRRSAEMICAGAPQLRPARPAGAALRAASEEALTGAADAAGFFRRWFRPLRLKAAGFLTGYYEVAAEARRRPEPGFATPVLSRPPDLVTLNDNPLIDADGVALTSARRRADGGLEPYAARRAIEDGLFEGPLPLAYVRDRVELFLMQVQGSARLRFPDGASMRLTYDGRNGRPYTSVGRLLIERGLVAKERMSLETLKATLRGMGLGPGEAGRGLLQENQSYIFFRADDSPARAEGPIGGQGCALSPLRSIAVDRSLWAYGLPFWIRGEIPWQGEEPSPFARLLIAQDTGSAILGGARADLYCGCGDRAGILAGSLRHAAEFVVLSPRGV